MAYVFPRPSRRVASPLPEQRDGFAFGPVLFGGLLGAGLGVMLAMLLDDGLRTPVHDLSATIGAWWGGALAGAVCGGLLSAWMGSDVDEDDPPEPPETGPVRRNPIR